MTATDHLAVPRRLAIVGVGLLGGSVAAAMRRLGEPVHIVGVGRGSSNLKDALDRGLIDEAHESIEKACEGCDVVVIATPVHRIAEQVVRAAQCTPEACLITDVGSTKAGIVQSVASDALAASKFVAAHPIAGSEKTGATHAREDLFDDKMVILTPTEMTTDFRHRQAETFWRSTGGRCLTMTPEQHDQQLAAISHVPHLMSALVAIMTPTEALSCVGSGWRDITRVAAGDPEMWTAICAENQTAIGEHLAQTAMGLQQLSQWIQAGDYSSVQEWLKRAQDLRNQAGVG